MEWKNPPEFGESRIDKTLRELKANPGQWALIATNSGVAFMPWWLPIANDDRFEVRRVPLDDQGPFGQREIYARFKTLFQDRTYEPPEPVDEQIHYDESTLDKVAAGLRGAGLTGQQVQDAISNMQNNGILFRESR